MDKVNIQNEYAELLILVMLFIKDNYDQKFNDLQVQQHPAAIHQAVLRRFKALCWLTKVEHQA